MPAIVSNILDFADSGLDLVVKRRCGFGVCFRPSDTDVLAPVAFHSIKWLARGVMPRTNQICLFSKALYFVGSAKWVCFYVLDSEVVPTPERQSQKVLH